MTIKNQKFGSVQGINPNELAQAMQGTANFQRKQYLEAKAKVKARLKQNGNRS